MDIQFDNTAVHGHLRGGIEVSQEELKKQNAQARRFNNSAIKGHPQMDSIKGALKVLQPEQLLQVLHNTSNALNGTTGRNSQDQYDVPQLAAPPSLPEMAAEASVSGQDKLSASAQFTELLAKITTLTNETSLQNISGRLQAYNAMFAGTTQKFTDMADELMQKGEDLASKEEALNKVREDIKALHNDVTKAKDALSQAKERLASLQAQMKQDVPVSPELKNKIDQAQAAVIGAESKCNTSTKALNDCEVGPLAQAKAAVVQARNNLSEANERARNLVNSMTPAQQSAIEGQRAQQDDTSVSLEFLMALMSQLIDKSASEDLDASSQLKQKLAEAAQKDAEKKAKEYEEQARKAEETQKTMGCIGKIIGWAITAIGFIAAAFTGGASLALAAIGLALAVGDEIYQAATGESFMQKAMEPLMKSVIQPMMKFFGDMFTALLEVCGVDKSTAEMAGQIMGAVTAAIMMVVGMVIASSVMSKIGGGVIGKIASKAAEATSKKMTQLMQKVISSSARQTIKRVTEKFSRALSINEVKVAKYANYVNKVNVGAEFATDTAISSANIYTAELLVKASRAQAKMMNDNALQDVLNQMLDQSIERFKNRIAVANQIVKKMADIADHNLQTGKYISRQMGTMAG